MTHRAHNYRNSFRLVQCPFCGAQKLKSGRKIAYPLRPIVIIYGAFTLRMVKLKFQGNSFPRSILVRHIRHAQFPRDLLVTSLRGCHEDVMRKIAS